MPEDVAIAVEQVSKAYRIWESPAARLTSTLYAGLAGLFPAGSAVARHLNARAARGHRDFHALENVSFDVKRGESVGIIGRNGSGKSTLLQIIAGTLRPSAGRVRVNGRVAALLELGSGFNPDFTGRENVFLNGAVLGLTKAEVEARLPKITAFADIGDFLDEPVKSYSSGMMIRLAFAVAINVDAEIVIVDEALSVGDMNFQAKCITALRHLQQAGVTFLIVTHGTETVKSMCERGVYLKAGRMVSIGPAADVADLYFKEMREQLSDELARSRMPNLLPTKAVTELASPANSSDRPVFRPDQAFLARIAEQRSGTGEARIQNVELIDAEGRSTVSVKFDQAVRIRIHVLLNGDLEFNCGYHLRDEFSLTLLSSGTFTETQTVLRGRAGDQLVIELATSLPLRHGRYSILGLVSTNYIMNKTAQFVDWVENAVVFEVEPRAPQILWAPIYLRNTVKIWHYPA